MAYAHDVGDYGYSEYEDDGYDAPQASSNKLISFTNVIGAVLSIGLIIGLCVWGYRLVQRDVSGIPVVQAAAGEMRVRPTDPGGQLASNQGLAVNAVAAQGEAEKPAETLVLAPPPPDLSDQDLPKPTPSAAPVQQPEPLDIANALESGELETLVARLTDAAEPLELVATDLSKRVTVEPSTEVAAKVQTTEKPQVVPASLPGTAWSKRPALRPAVQAVVTPVVAPEPVETGPTELAAADIPAGTRLVQLGAYDSAETARKEWDRFKGRFGEYMTDKDRVVQRATSGGRVFYRLRAHGFADLSDARRFCAVLVAGKADCIPVVTR
ncbi:MAG: SPOR domain-containing protein [Rhodobacteraceae bacterium]|nr:SPOR domain-containing protein [Paracoccaceae bacterium]